jgi:hypothetical protein
MSYQSPALALLVEGMSGGHCKVAIIGYEAVVV